MVTAAFHIMNHEPNYILFPFFLRRTMSDTWSDREPLGCTIEYKICSMVAGGVVTAKCCIAATLS